jgi:hypothetical protein
MRTGDLNSESNPFSVALRVARRVLSQADVPHYSDGAYIVRNTRSLLALLSAKETRITDRNRHKRRYVLPIFCMVDKTHAVNSWLSLRDRAHEVMCIELTYGQAGSLNSAFSAFVNFCHKSLYRKSHKLVDHNRHRNVCISAAQPRAAVFYGNIETISREFSTKKCTSIRLTILIHRH